MLFLVDGVGERVGMGGKPHTGSAEGVGLGRREFDSASLPTGRGGWQTASVDTNH